MDVNARNLYGYTALYYAAQNNFEDIFIYLLNQVSLVDKEILIGAIEATKSHNLSIVQKLLENNFQSSI